MRSAEQMLQEVARLLAASDYQELYGRHEKGPLRTRRSERLRVRAEKLDAEATRRLAREH